MARVSKKGLLTITDEETADKILALIAGELDPREASENAAKWDRQCYNAPNEDDVIMEAINELLGTYGVEGQPCEEDPRHGISYCNTGDTYALTVFYFSKSGKFRLATQEDIFSR